MTYEITPARDIAPAADIHYPAATVSDIYAIARDIARVARIAGPVTVSGTHVIAGNVLIARVRQTEPWQSVTGPVITGPDYVTRPTN